MTSEQKGNAIDDDFKKNNKALHSYRNNSAARSLGADIKSIDVDKLEKEMEKELIESLKKLDKESEKIRKQEVKQEKGGIQYESIYPEKGKPLSEKDKKNDGSKI
jgi:hypothetical protein